MCRLEAINPPFAGTTHLGVIQTGSFQSAYVNPTKEKHKKPRASKPKIKPGCVTCRARRVKCDETKPHCLRCQKFGRLCDGYVPVTQNRTHQSQPRIFTAHSRAIPYSPSVSIHTTEEEFRYFQIFIERPAHEIPGFFDASLWTHIIPQASHTFESIRHSVNSLGALYKAFEEAPGPNLKVIVIQAIGKKHREQAILQHLRAIQALNKYITCSASPQLRVALLANLLFICFETLQEEHASAVQQLVGGLKILRSYYSGQPRSTPWIPALKNHSDTLSHKKLCTAFVNWQKDVSLARDRAIANYVEEYLEGNKSTGTVSTPNEIQQIPSPRSTGEDPELDTADFQKHYSLFLGLAKDKVEESPGEDQRHMDDSISSTSQDGASSYPTSRRPSTTFSVSTNISAGTRTTLSTMPRLYPSSTMGVSDHDVSRQSGSEARTGPLEPYHTTHPGPILHNDEKIEETLVRTFMRLDGSSTFFGMVPGIPPLKWDVQNAWSDPIPAAPFKDIPSAHLCWDSIMDRALSFYRRINFNQNYYPFLQDSVENVRDEQAMFLQQLNDFRICFTPILEESLTSKPDEIANPVALLISIYWRLVRMLLDSLLSETEMIYDNYFPDFEYIVKTCNQLASSPSTVYLQDSSRFSLEVGIIPALHFTATKCRDPVIRRDAIALLFAHPKEEGFYDGVLSARIGRWIAACEEDGLSIGIPDDTTPPSSPSGNALDRSQPGRTIDCDNEEADQKKFIRKPPIIPEENRVKLIVVDYHISERYLKARCQKVLPGSDGKREERDTVIAW
ncbi:hypothetical protein DL95DRAFT_319114 [Leptodontidium sp. 2 PMI_412]|nr:hypothetical protein DL95DRAFT_319114 [Leptodontidium sp. 2 PMI_412]